jgi:hypothetical protein
LDHLCLNTINCREIPILEDCLQDVPLEVRWGLWFQHDGVQAHFVRCVRQFLNKQFQGCWIGQGGPQTAEVAWYNRL